MANYLRHFSHGHQLVKTQSSSKQFNCDLCHTKGSGLRYRCHACDFDLHEYCANLPQTISFFAHPWHNLHLGPGSGQPRICDLCREPVGGFFYHCISCSFDVHPHCTETKQIVRTGLHPEHSLCLVPCLNICSACNEFDGKIWLYRCGMCSVNLHMKCLHGPIKPNKMSDANNNQLGSLGPFLREVALQTTANTIANSLTGLFN